MSAGSDPGHTSDGSAATEAEAEAGCAAGLAAGRTSLLCQVGVGYTPGAGQYNNNGSLQKIFRCFKQEKNMIYSKQKLPHSDHWWSQYSQRTTDFPPAMKKVKFMFLSVLCKLNQAQTIFKNQENKSTHITKKPIYLLPLQELYLFKKIKGHIAEI